MPDDWRDRLGSAAQGVAVIKPGDRMFIGSACATPRTLLTALEHRNEGPPASR